MGVEPSIATLELVKELRAGTVTTRQPPPHNLTPLPTSFVGRKRELSHILARLCTADCRLLTLIGSGGMGKTRLALQTAQTLVDNADPLFPDGIFFVPLQPIPTIDGIFAAIAEAADFHFYSSEPPEKQLAQFLHDKKMLLVLDNFEHLLAGAALVSRLLLAAPYVKILATSREALQLQEEWFHAVGGMSLPQTTVSTPALTSYDAIDFFERCARRVQINFDLTAVSTDVLHICQLVDGIPLAIELATAWLKLLPISEIGAEIERGIDILTSRHHNMPSRHRSMRAILEQSWALLSDEERIVFQKLAVFQGGFTHEAARAVAGASLLHLATFVDKSLLRVEKNSRFNNLTTSRYQLHALLHQYAAEQLAASPEETAVYDTHAAYYAQFLHEKVNRLMGGSQQLAFIQTIDIESKNCWAAWQRAMEQENLEAIYGMILPLQLLCQVRGQFLKGATAWEVAYRRVKQLRPTLKTKIILIELLVYWGWLLLRLGQLEQAEKAFHECRQLYDELSIPTVPGFHNSPTAGLSLLYSIRGEFETAVRYAQEAVQKNSENNCAQNNLSISYYTLASANLGQGNYEAAYRYASQAYELTVGIEDRWFMAYCLIEMGNSALAMGNLVEAKEHFEKSYQLREAYNDPEGMAAALNSLGKIALRACDLNQAQALFAQSLAIYRRLNDQGGLARTHHGLGTTAVREGSFAEAQTQLTIALSLAAEMDFAPLQLEILTHIGELKVKRGEQAAGIELLRFVRMHTNSGEAGMLLEEAGDGIETAVFASYQTLAEIVNNLLNQ